MPTHPTHGGPTHCRNCGTAMEPGNVFVGWTGCGCDEPHRTWRCKACRFADCLTQARADQAAERQPLTEA